MKFTKISDTVFEEIQLNAGILLSEFTPSSASVDLSKIVGATSGGVNFTDKPEYTDFGDDIDNCPKNTMELKRINSREVTMSGNFVSVTKNLVKDLIGSADVDSSDATKITPRDELVTTDFKELWWVGDYSDKNGATNGGYIAIHMMNVLNTDGFAIQSGDQSKGQFAFNYTAHYSIEDQDTVPYEVYVKAGTAES